MAELGVRLAVAAETPFFEREMKRYEVEKSEILKAADKLDKHSEEFNVCSEGRMHQHHRWAQATTPLQIAIAMAAIALLTKRRWLEKAVFLVSGIGLVVGFLAYLHV